MTIPEQYRPLMWGLGIVTVYLLLVFASPIRGNLRDGLRCVRRHPTLWMVLALFGVCYAVYDFGVLLFFHYKLEEHLRPEFALWHAWSLPPENALLILKMQRMPALENLAGLFNVLVIVYPLSAVAGLLFFANWDGHHAVLFRALRKRFRTLGLAIHAGMLVCAAAAVVKPLMFAVLYKFETDPAKAQWIYESTFFIEWLAFLFEIMFGTAVQIYLILLAYAWVRGLTFTHRHLIDFAIRRFSSVIKWSLVVMLLGTLLINIPRIVISVPWFAEKVPAGWLPFDFPDEVGRPVVAGVLLIFFSVQIVLTFHGESLGAAIRDHFRFLRKEWIRALCLLAVGFMHFYFLNTLREAVKAGFGEGTAGAIAWTVFYPIPAACVAAWMLASWVCLYKRSETGRARSENWIQY